MTAPLSPAAQAVLDAFLAEWNDCFLEQDRRCIAAALRAAADQVAPEADPPQRGDFSDRSVYLWEVDVHAYDDATRRKILAIAAELEDAATTESNHG